MRYFVILMLTLFAMACKSNQNTAANVETIEKNELVFLQAAEAGDKIVVDKSDGFFGQLTIADMSIQMRQSDMPASGGAAKEKYQQMLRSEMLDFTQEDKDFMVEVFAAAKKVLDKVNPALYPDKIELIKTKTNHYGPDVYYTRDNAIILPANIFEAKSVEAQMPIMLHEIFHILSRYNDELRDELYALIGFYPYKETLVLPKRISDYLLTNPDGVRRDYAIHLKDEKGTLQRALPLILSRKERYDPAMPSFFSYLHFDLFPLIPITENQVTLGLNQNGESALSIEHNANFFQLIKDNTQYIIHPDEILADNFMMAVIAHSKNDYSGFSPEGKQLLQDVIAVLADFEQ